MKEITVILKKTMLFNSLNNEALRQTAAHAVKQHLNKGSVLFFAGEPGKGMFVVAQGIVRGFRTGADGREQIIFLEHAPATIAETPVFDNGAYFSTVVAEEDTLVYFFEKKYIRKLCVENPSFALDGLRVMASKVRNLADLVEELTLHDVSKRLAHFILLEADRRGEPKNAEIYLKLNLTRAQIAGCIGTVREVVSRNLTLLKSEGLIRFEKRCLIISNKEKLIEFCEKGGKGRKR